MNFRIIRFVRIPFDFEPPRLKHKIRVNVSKLMLKMIHPSRVFKALYIIHYAAVHNLTVQVFLGNYFHVLA